MKRCLALLGVLACSSGLLAQPPDPSTLPRLTESSLTYVGAFRTPAETSNGISFDGGGRQLAFNPANGSLFAGAWFYLSELTIPTPVNSADVNALPRATFRQGFFDPMEGKLPQLSPSLVEFGNVLVAGDRLVGTGYLYYDANNTARQSHFSRSLNLSQPSFSGWSQVWQPTGQGFVAGFMSLIPPEWQARLGGPAITGACCLSIIDRTSYGPSAFAFNPAQVGQPTVAATPLVYYPSTNPTLGPWEGSNPTYGTSARVGGVAIIAGTRTALFFGRNGIGPYCYGDGSPLNPPPPGQCYDPVYQSKSQHSYPYRYQVWAYDLNDFAAVKAGSKQPWEIIPYRVWELTFPIDNAAKDVGGVAYDTPRQRLYVSQLYGDGTSPLIHVFQVDATAQPAPAPVPTPAPTPVPAPVPTPQPTPAPVTLTASPGTITAGQSSTLTLATPTTDYHNVFINGVRPSVWTCTTTCVGTLAVSPSTTTTYQAVATNSSGQPYAMPSVVVTVSAAPIPVPEPPPPAPAPVPVPASINCTVETVYKVPYPGGDAKLLTKCDTNGVIAIPKGTTFILPVKP